MKFYIATGLGNWKQHNLVRDALIKDGHTITYDWTVHGPVWDDGVDDEVRMIRLAQVCDLELQGVLRADRVIVLLPGGRGTHVELGVALALSKDVFIVSSDETQFAAHPNTCAFYHNECVVPVVYPEGKDEVMVSHLLDMIDWVQSNL